MSVALHPYTALAVALALLAGCATVPRPEPVSGGAPTEWVAPLPHGGQESELTQWWRRFDDLLVAEMVEAAENDSPTLAQAAARIAQARAQQVQAGSPRLPSVTANAGATRSHSEVTVPAGTISSSTASADVSWELDVFGRVRAGVEGADARADASVLRWHDARVSLAAEVATTYAGLRACQGLVQVYEQDVASQRQTAELTETKVRGGFEAPANGALAWASASDAKTTLIAQRAECDLSVKALVSLTGIAEVPLRARLAQRTALLPQPAGFNVPSVPAQALVQRPDLAAAERDLAAALADIDARQADRYPRLNLLGSVGYASATFGGANASGSTWSFGPSLSLPLFDAGRRAAVVEEARARYDESAATYRARARQAVREVEEALVRLDAAGRREEDSRRAAEGYTQFFEAAHMRWRVGTGSLLDLEQARRTALTARAGLIQVQRDRLSAWIALYKAVGGGWTPPPATGKAQGG